MKQQPIPIPKIGLKKGLRPSDKHTRATWWLIGSFGLVLTISACGAQNDLPIELQEAIQLHLQTKQQKLNIDTLEIIRPAASGKLIDFENLAPGTRVTTQYSGSGVRFVPSAYLSSASDARSGNRVLRAANPSSEFHSGPMTLELTSDHRSVSFYAGKFYSGSVSGTLRAYAANGQFLAQDGPKTISGSGFHTQFSITANGIRKLVLQYAGTAFESIDDLYLVGSAPDLPTEPPTVVIDSPQSGSIIHTSTINLTGQVTGEQLISHVLAEQTLIRPSGSPAPSEYQHWMQLTGSGLTRRFSRNLGLYPGIQFINVKAENTAGLTGTRGLYLIYLSKPLYDRIMAESGNLGYYQFAGQSSSNCSYVVFSEAAVAAIGNTTYLIQGTILDKWLAETDLSGYPRLGCPTEEQRDFEGDAALAQDFQKARIYATGSNGFMVPRVFVDAIEASGGERATGIPMEDTSSSIGAQQTWLFQRYRGFGSERHLATLQIRGTPARMYIERIGGDKTQIPYVAPDSPTIVQIFDCQDADGPCDVSLPEEEPLEDIGRYCNYSQYPTDSVGRWFRDPVDVIRNPDCPEWPAIVGDYVQTPLQGIVTKAHMSSEDNPLAHEYRYNCPPSLLTFALSEILDEDRQLCNSDWDIMVKPLTGWKHLLAPGRDDMPIEYESYFGQHFHVGYGYPRAGQLIFASGRWIVDCGHDYKTEIHPPSVLAHMNTVEFEGQPATVANVWVNGFYSGEPVRLDIHPPPRPDPNALLTVSAPGVTGLDVTVQDSIIGSQFLRLQFSASRREVEVKENTREMKWEHGRGYEARWYVYWD